MRSIKELNEQLNKFNEDEALLNDLFGHLEEKKWPRRDNLIAAGNNDIYLHVKDGKIYGEDTNWIDGERKSFELTPEICKNKDSLLKELKRIGILHPETIDIERCSIDDSHFGDGQDFIILYGLVDENNPKINITRQSGGRGTQVVLIKDKTEDEIENAINAVGKNISDYDVIKETSKGTLVLAKVRPWDDKKAFLIKDGKAKSASVATLCAIIKEG